MREKYVFFGKSDRIKKEGKTVCILDLDLNGSSWYYNFSSLRENRADKVYLEQLVKNFDKYKNQKIMNNLNIMVEEKLYSIPVICVHPEKADIVTNEMEEDLFENSIYKIFHYLRIEKYDSIIIDMPPSTDKYSERILKHLLLDVNSVWAKEMMNERENNYNYHVEICEMAAISSAHIHSSIKWIFDFFTKEKTYSELMSDEKLLDCKIILNDTNNVVSGNIETSLREHIRTQIDGELSKCERFRTPKPKCEKFLIRYNSSWCNAVIKEYAMDVSHETIQVQELMVEEL